MFIVIKFIVIISDEIKSYGDIYALDNFHLIVLSFLKGVRALRGYFGSL